MVCLPGRHWFGPLGLGPVVYWWDTFPIVRLLTIIARPLWTISAESPRRKLLW